MLPHWVIVFGNTQYCSQAVLTHIWPQNRLSPTTVESRAVLPVDS